MSGIKRQSTAFGVPMIGPPGAVWSALASLRSRSRTTIFGKDRPPPTARGNVSDGWILDGPLSDRKGMEVDV